LKNLKKSCQELYDYVWKEVTKIREKQPLLSDNERNLSF